MKRLVISLPEAHGIEQELSFVLLTDGAAQPGRAPAAALGALGAQEVVALVPPRLLSWHAVQLPPGVHARSARLRAVLEGLLEEQLLGTPDALHLALVGSGPHWVAACDRRWLAMGVQGLEAVGCKLSRVLPEWGPPGPPRLHIGGTVEQPRLLVCSPTAAVSLPWDGPVPHSIWPGQIAKWDHCTAEPELLALARQRLEHPVTAWPRSERWAAAAGPDWDLSAGLRMRRQARRSPLQWLQAPRWQAVRWALAGLLAVNLAGLTALAWTQERQLLARRTELQQVLVQTFAHLQHQPVSDAPVQMARELQRLRAASGQAAAGDLPVMLGAVLGHVSAERSLQALDYVPGQLRLQGLNLSASEVQALAARLQPLGYRVRAEGAELRVQEGP